MKKYLIICAMALIILSTGEIYAQPTQKQAGFRFGGTTGFTGKIIKDDYFAYEGILGFRSGGAQLYLLFEGRRPVFYNRIENIYLYFGGGFHGGFVRWNDYYYGENKYSYPYHHPGNNYNHTGPVFGIDGIIGMEYTFTSVPIALAMDFKPFLEAFGPFMLRANFWDFGFYIRYNF